MVGDRRNISSERHAVESSSYALAAVAASDDAIFTQYLDGTIGSWNAAAERIFGFTAQEALGAAAALITPPDMMAEAESVLARTAREGCIVRHTTARQRKDGVRIDLSLIVSPVLNSPSQAVCFTTIARDISEQKRTETTLRESASRNEAILNTTVDGIITIDERGVIETFNPAAERLFCYAATEVIGKNVKVLMPEPYRGDHDGYLRNYIVTGEAKIIGIGREVIGRRKDGTMFPMDLAVSEVRLHEPRIFTGIVRDLTERKRLERGLIEISDREQRRIGQDLHDGLGQMLAGIGFLSKSLETRTAAQSLPEAADARQIAQLVAQAISQARGLARGLHPVDIKETGLMTGLEELAANVENMFRVRCEFHCETPVLVGDSAIATHVYRITQEAVNNAVKHGKAQRVLISLSQFRETVTVSIEDDGIGFPNILPEKRGMGLQIMQYRAGLIGASIEIRRGAAGGTAVGFSFHYPSRSQHGVDSTGIKQ